LWFEWKSPSEVLARFDADFIASADGKEYASFEGRPLAVPTDALNHLQWPPRFIFDIHAQVLVPSMRRRAAAARTPKSKSSLISTDGRVIDALSTALTGLDLRGKSPRTTMCSKCHGRGNALCKAVEADGKRRCLCADCCRSQDAGACALHRKQQKRPKAKLAPKVGGLSPASPPTAPAAPDDTGDGTDGDDDGDDP